MSLLHITKKIYNHSTIFQSAAILQRNAMIFNTTTEAIKVIQFRCYAARKGTRERKAKAKVKKVVEKVGFIPHNQRNKDKLMQEQKSKKIDDLWKRLPTDNVYPMKYYQAQTYSFADAIEAHRETHHPEMYNKPNAEVFVNIELNMQGQKKTRFVADFKRIAGIPHTFDHGEERLVLAFSKDADKQKQALDAGAQLAGGVELIKQIQNGQINLQDFQHIVAHPDILPELVPLRGILKKKFPNPQNGNLDVNVGDLVQKLINGINYSAVKDEIEKDFGTIDTIIGKLSMDAKHLEENFAALLLDVNTVRPKREGSFITKCWLLSPPSREKFKVDHSLYLKQTPTITREALEEEDDEPHKENVAAN